MKLQNTESNTISIILAADDHYAQHLGVTICSILENNSDVDIYIIDGGITPENKERFQRLSEKYSARIKFLSIDPKMYDGFSLGAHFSPAAYYRLSIPSILPKNMGRVLYLDCDMVVIANLRELWTVDLGSNYVGAVSDFGMMELFSGFLFESELEMNEEKFKKIFLDATTKYNRKIATFNTLDIPKISFNMVDLEKITAFACSPEVELEILDSHGVLTLEKRNEKIRVYRLDGSFTKRLGLPRDANYFNSGMLLINLNKWRENDIGRKTMQYIAQNQSNAKFFDQDALNVVLQGLWLSLPERFNTQCNVNIVEKPDTVVVHYVSVFKPWYWYSKFAYSEHYQKYLAKTPWSGVKRPFDGRDLGYIKFMAKQMMPSPVNKLIHIIKNSYFTKIKNR